RVASSFLTISPLSTPAPFRPLASLPKGHAGSLMLVDRREGILQIKARLGQPRETRKSEPVFRVDDKSIAGYVASTGASYLCTDVGQDSKFRPSRTGPSFHSLLCVPIVHDGKVIAVINADADKPGWFTKTDERKLEQVAKAAAELVARKIGVLDALLEVTKFLVRMPRYGGVEAVLKKIAEVAVDSLGVDVVTLYQYDQEHNRFLVEGHGPTVGGTLLDPAPMKKMIYPEDVPYRIVKGGETVFLEDVRSRNDLCEESTRVGADRRPRFIDREGIKSMAALLLPHNEEARDPARNGEIVGVMFANYRKHHEFNIDERKTLGTFADYASIAILNARSEAQRVDEAKQTVEAVTGAIAHRMNRLFNASMLAVENLRSVIPRSDEKSHKRLDLVQDQARLLFGLADRLKVRIKAGSETSSGPVSLGDTVQTALRDIKAEIGIYGDAIEIDNQVPEEGLMVLCDPVHLRQVIYDLVRNSVDSIQTKNAELAGKDFRFKGKIVLRVTDDPSQTALELTINDNGTGIEEEKQKKLFLPGYTTKGTLGIGLWWCRTYISATGGEIFLKESKPGENCTFALRLVRVKVQTPGEADYEPAILIIEDDQNTANEFAALLEPLTYRVDQAHSLDEARRLLALRPYSLLLVDVNLDDSRVEADRQGFRILEFVKTHQANTKIVFVTAYDNKFEMNQMVADNSQVVAWFSKSEILPKEFVAEIKQIIK
ncbi:MAG: GAF domain-containing protein, partial [Deltaproteobacteria bacterium]|nr:GAF domain-containing protein [Deltaproteobacteria bacterium]